MRQLAENRKTAVYATGVVRGVTDEINLRTEITGRVARILIGEAQWVNKGEVLIEIANEQYQYHVDLAQAELDVATAELQRLTNGARQLEREELHYLHQAKTFGISTCAEDLGSRSGYA